MDFGMTSLSVDKKEYVTSALSCHPAPRCGVQEVSHRGKQGHTARVPRGRKKIPRARRGGGARGIVIMDCGCYYALFFFSHSRRRRSGRCFTLKCSKVARNPSPSGLAPITPTCTGVLSCSQALRMRVYSWSSNE